MFLSPPAGYAVYQLADGVCPTMRSTYFFVHEGRCASPLRNTGKCRQKEEPESPIKSTVSINKIKKACINLFLCVCSGRHNRWLHICHFLQHVLLVPVGQRDQETQAGAHGRQCPASIHGRPAIYGDHPAGGRHLSAYDLSCSSGCPHLHVNHIWYNFLDLDKNIINFPIPRMLSYRLHD